MAERAADAGAVVTHMQDGLFWAENPRGSVPMTVRALVSERVHACTCDLARAQRGQLDGAMSNGTPGCFCLSFTLRDAAVIVCGTAAADVLRRYADVSAARAALLKVRQHWQGLVMIPYTASLFNGLSRLFEMAFHIDYAYCVIGMALLTGLYVIIGGYMATAVNDFIQGVIMLIGIVAVIAAVLSQNGGFMGSLVELSKVESDVMGGAYVSFFGPNPGYLFFVVMLTSVGTWGLPQMVGKFYAIRDEGAVKKGTLISTAFAVIVAGGCYFLGGFGRLFSTAEKVAAEGFDSIIPQMLSTLPDLLTAIVLILVLSASMSTLSSLVLTSSSTLTLDLIDPMTEGKNSEKKNMTIMRVFIAFFIVVSAVIAIIQARSRVTFIAQLMGISWGALAGAFLAPFLYGLFWKKATKAGAAASFIYGVTLMIIQLCISLGWIAAPAGFLGLVFRNSLYSGVFAMFGGLIIVPVVSALTRKQVPAKVDDYFSCYNATVEVPAATALGESVEASGK